MPALGSTFCSEEVIVLVPLDDVRSLSQTIRTCSNHCRGGQRPATGQVNLRDMDRKVFQLAIQGPMGNPGGCGKVRPPVIIPE